MMRMLLLPLCITVCVCRDVRSFLRVILGVVIGNDSQLYYQEDDEGPVKALLRNPPPPYTLQLHSQTIGRRPCNVAGIIENSVSLEAPPAPTALTSNVPSASVHPGRTCHLAPDKPLVETYVLLGS